jgi:DinB family protein
MNQALELRWSWIEGSHAMRNAMLDTLTDADLAFNPGGQNMTLGALCRELGEVEYAYLQSFKTLTQDFKWRNTEPGLDQSPARLKTWFQTLDEEMKAVLSAVSDDDARKMIDRSGYKVPVDMQVEIYLQAALIFLGKATIFLKALNKPLSKDVMDWIG